MPASCAPTRTVYTVMLCVPALRPPVPLTPRPYVCHRCRAPSSMHAINTHAFVLLAIHIALRAFKFEPKLPPKFRSLSSSHRCSASAMKGRSRTPLPPSLFCLKPQPVTSHCSAGTPIAATFFLKFSHVAFASIYLFSTLLEELITSYRVPDVHLPIPQLDSSNSLPWSPATIGPSSSLPAIVALPPHNPSGLPE